MENKGAEANVARPWAAAAAEEDGQMGSRSQGRRAAPLPCSHGPYSYSRD